MEKINIIYYKFHGVIAASSAFESCYILGTLIERSFSTLKEIPFNGWVYTKHKTGNMLCGRGTLWVGKNLRNRILGDDGNAAVDGYGEKNWW